MGVVLCSGTWSHLWPPQLKLGQNIDERLVKEAGWWTFFCLGRNRGLHGAPAGSEGNREEVSVGELPGFQIHHHSPQQVIYLPSISSCWGAHTPSQYTRNKSYCTLALYIILKEARAFDWKPNNRISSRKSEVVWNINSQLWALSTANYFNSWWMFWKQLGNE